MVLRLPSRTPRSKYSAIKTRVDGITFDSRKEARRYQELLCLAKAGEICQLQLQPKFDLGVVNQFSGDVVKVGTYTADFDYIRCAPKLASGWKRIIEDVKSPATRTTVYRLKKRMVEAIYGITITEV